MTPHLLGRRLFLAGLAVFLCPVAMGAPPAAQNPWAKVPAFPTGCYSSRDDFATKIAAAQEALPPEIYRQEQINKELQDRVKNMDPAQVSSAMMKNPQEMMKIMQENQALGTANQETGQKDEEKRNRLDLELKDLVARYHSALDKARGPIDAKRKTLPLPSGEYAGERWAIAENIALTKKANTEYEKLCGEWWSASGPFLGWLKRYRDYLVQDHIPRQEKSDDIAMGTVRLMGASTASYRSTAAMKGVLDYMKRASEVFGAREAQPRVP